MIHSFIIVTASGVVLFHHAFTQSVSQPRLVGGLLTALAQYSRAALGVPLAHLRMRQTSVTLVETPFRTHLTHSNTTSPNQSQLETLTCAVFHDPLHSESYASLIASELLSAFLQQFGEPLSTLQLAAIEHLHEEFKLFSSRVLDVLRGAFPPILLHLERKPQIQHVMLLRLNKLTHFDTREFQTELYASPGIRNTGFTSKLLALLNSANDLMSVRYQSPSAIRVASNVLLQKLESDPGIILVAVSDSLSSTQVSKSFGTAFALLNELFEMLANFHGT